MEKALQFGLIAAHLNPSDSDEWIRLAEMSLEQDNIRQAIVCYTKGKCDDEISQTSRDSSYLECHVWSSVCNLLFLLLLPQPSSTVPPTCATCGSAPACTCVWVSTNSAWMDTEGSCRCCPWRKGSTSCSFQKTWLSKQKQGQNTAQFWKYLYIYVHIYVM